MRWEGINEFVAVAETHSFTLAAKKLNISTAQVSRQISALEKHLNIKLFYRTTRHVSLTQEAQLFYQHCRHLLESLEAAEQALKNLQATPQGTIKLSAPITYGEQKIIPLINNFVTLYPDIEIISDLSNHRVDLLEGGFDIAIRLGQLEDSSLIAKKLSERVNYLCASPQYIEKFGVPHSLCELKNHNCLLGTRDYWRFNEQGRQKSVRVKGNIRCNSGVGLVDAALKHIGIVQLPDYYIQSYLDSGQLLTVLDNKREPPEGIWALYPQNRYLSPKIALLLDYLCDHLGEQSI
ncbi:LysR family transcriptional regulator [Psychromonas antarctica]|uniref:LysR family transcriptional regulator n=1 Tax=Psychromonas antarctica TaxID=67573 RepID=UPI001EE89751|nr:LysR family transcriptional regulator [Psychromonas antarctica]MCG6199977.1 LysR family transcriptional regulator [Psychromonas antarctica]